jgi:hypothetical protein
MEGFREVAERTGAISNTTLPHSITLWTNNDL